MDPLGAMCEKPGKMPIVDSGILDGAAVCQSLDPHRTIGRLQHLKSMLQNHFYLTSTRLQSVSRMDIIFDVYIEDSLKSHTRQTRGTGEHMQVHPSLEYHLTGKHIFETTETKLAYFSISQR